MTDLEFLAKIVDLDHGAPRARGRGQMASRVEIDDEATLQAELEERR